MHMTEGKISRQLVTYSIPLILGNLFQLTYNTLDSIIVGRFIGKEALAAVGATAPIANILILGISGICIGASVIMSEFFGAKDYKMLKKEMATTSVFGLFFSLVLTLIGVITARPFLELFNTPAEILDMATTYLRIIYLGIPFTYFYNSIAAALKSIGDSKTPLKFLAFAATLNAVLDLIFIGGLNFGIVCSATTTVIAEAVSALLCVAYVYKKIPILQVRYSEFRIDRALLKKTLGYGSITALQQSCQPIGKLLIQGAVNLHGVDMIAAFNAVSRIDDFAFTPQQSVSHGITTFVAQNRGAKKYNRILNGFKNGMVIEVIYWMLICATVLLLKEPIMRMFVTEEGSGDIIALGSQYLGLMAFFYILPAFTNGVQGFFRGMGNMNLTLIGTLIQTSLRVVFTYLLSPTLGINGIAYSCVIGWTAMLIFAAPFYLKFRNQYKLYR
ncbi:hypothetical protein JCM10512_3611 [Bacteroides reticulotermitis JCM 10512]|uniref:Multidrug-efflux transporter n=2 Tax=Bacteroides reticulotermitis TaxID=1133319 RepID=W4UX64_9BACE|nr:hypothetical protein JCM10512_3611 [Bacteroides reticulotermitis JCM 10512]